MCWIVLAGKIFSYLDQRLLLTIRFSLFWGSSKMCGVENYLLLPVSVRHAWQVPSCICSHAKLSSAVISRHASACVSRLVHAWKPEVCLGQPCSHNHFSAVGVPVTSAEVLQALTIGKGALDIYPLLPHSWAVRICWESFTREGFTLLISTSVFSNHPK